MRNLKTNVANLGNDVGAEVAANAVLVAMRLRAVPEFAQIRLVAVTGHGSEAHRAKARAAGFDEHLLKPVDLQMMDAVLASVSQSLRQTR